MTEQLIKDLKDRIVVDMADDVERVCDRALKAVGTAQFAPFATVVAEVVSDYLDELREILKARAA